jgi:hypothetical protein
MKGMIKNMKKCNQTKNQNKPTYIGILGPKGPKGDADKITIRNTITAEPDEEAKVIDTPKGNNHILDFIIPKGAQGTWTSAYLVKFNTGQEIEIKPNEKIPIDRKEIDIQNIITLNNDQTINFNKIGYYRITIILEAYTKNNQNFNKEEDFVTIGLKQNNTDNIYIGASTWSKDDIPHQTIAQGILAIDNKENTYYIENLGKKSIYLNSPDITNISSASYFTNSLVTISIEYLGRQTI